MLWNVLQALFGFLTAAVGIAGNTWDATRSTFLKRVTKRGWCAVVLALCTFTVTVIKEVISEREATERVAASSLLQTKLLAALERQAEQAQGTPQARQAAVRLGEELQALPRAPEPKSTPARPPPIAPEEPKWLTLARKEVGVKETGEVPGNARIISYLGSTLLSGTPLTEQIPWSAAFVNWALRESGIPTPNSPSVAAWDNWGNGVLSPRVGCVALIQLPSGVRHMGFVAEFDDSRVTLIAGNVQDEVQFRSYPRREITSYRCVRDI